MSELNIYKSQLSDEEITRGLHREWVGGLWDELGLWQYDRLVNDFGLQPSMRLLDLGCGSFRAGVKLIPYLDKGNYYGIDVNESLIEAGLQLEIAHAGLADRISRDQVRVCDDFDASSFGVKFDMIWALSVWTHLPLNHIQLCLHNAMRVLADDGKFYASVFVPANNLEVFAPSRHEPGGIVSYRAKDPYHVTDDDISHLANQLPYPVRWRRIGDFAHPRGQQLLEFRK